MKKNITKKILLAGVLGLSIFAGILNTQATYYSLSYNQKIKADRFVNNVYNSMKDPCGGNYIAYQNRINNLDNYASYFGRNSRMYKFIKYSTQELTKKCTVFQEDNLFDEIGFNYTEKSIKKGNFVKYIGGGVEARQGKLFTYFYYNDTLINTVKNKIKNDKYLIYGYDYNGYYSDNYLSEYYAKKKLNLYSATLENNGKRIFFVKKTDSGQTNFAYDLETGKLEDWSFDLYQ